MELVLAALLMGLTGSLHCVGMCGGFAMAASAKSPLHGAAWHLGRWTTYAVAGALLGLLGGGLPGPAWLPEALAALGLLAFALSVGGWLHLPPGALPGIAPLAARFARGGGLASRYGFGLVTGLLPCGMTLAALSLALGAETPTLGAGAMVAFGAGTSPALAVASGLFARVARAGPGLRKVVSLAVLALGLLALAWRGNPVSEDPPDCHTSGVRADTPVLGQHTRSELAAAQDQPWLVAQLLRKRCPPFPEHA